MYRDAFRKFYWGFIFVLISIKIKGFVILFPDIIGYIFIYQGLRIFKDSNERFEKASKLIIPVMILSLTQIYQPGMEVMASNGLWFSITAILNIIDMVLHLMLMNNIFIGIGDLGHDNHKIEISLEGEKL